MDVTSLEQRAIDFARRGDFGAEARGINEELVRLVPSNLGAWTRLARCCLEVGALDGATAALDAALQLNPTNTIAHNLQLEVAKRRAGPQPAVRQRRSRAVPRPDSPRPSRGRPPAGGGFGRPEFTALAHLPPAQALDALARPIEGLLIALNERPFAAKAVEARNRAGHAGNRLFRRSGVHAGGPGHLFVYHHGGHREPQFNVGLFAASRFGRDAMRAGIGFHLAAADGDDANGEERALAFFARFQQLVASEWRPLLTTWMRSNGGIVQYGGGGPVADLLPEQAVSWIVNVQDPRELRWVFFGRWLFADRQEHAAVLSDAIAVARWAGQTFTDLLPLWTAVYRGH